MAFYNNVIAGSSAQVSGGDGGSSSGYQISKSLRFDQADSADLTRIPKAKGDQYTFTISLWFKRGEGDGTRMLFQTDTTYDDLFRLYLDGNGKFRVHYYTGGSYIWDLTSAGVFIDTAAWYHLHFVHDTKQGTGTDRLRVWINGIEITEWSNAALPPRHQKSGWNNVDTHRIGREFTTTYGNYYNWDGAIAEVHHVDGQNLLPTAFGETRTSDGVWVPKQFSGTYGWFNKDHKWSSYVSGSQYSSSYAIENGFDGQLNTRAGGGLTFTPPTPIPCTKVRVFLTSYDAPANTIYLNGVDVSDQIDDSRDLYADPMDFTPSNNQFVSWQCGSGGSEPGWFAMIQLLINDKWVTLIDSDVDVVDNSFYLDFENETSNESLGKSKGPGKELTGVDFDGTNDVIVSASHSDYTLGTNDFTIEFFVYPRTFDNYKALVMKYGGAANNSAWWITLNSAGGILFYLYPSDVGVVAADSKLILNMWNHVACVRDGSTARVYVNGAQAGTFNIGTDSVALSNADLTIGEDDQASYDLDGVISNVRIVNGTCLYPNGTGFTVPSTPLENITNTKLLCCQSSTSVTEATVSPNTLTTGGDPAISTVDDRDWTVSNLTNVITPSQFTWSGSLLSGSGGSGNPGGYSGSYFQVPAGTSSWDMHFETDSNTGWWFSDSTSQVATHPNQQSGNFVGHRNGNSSAVVGGSGFGSSNPSMPSDAMDGDPRWYWTVNRTTGSGTVKVGPSGTEYSFTVPTTGNVYFHVNAYGAYNYNLVTGELRDSDALVDTPTNASVESGNSIGNYCILNDLDRRSTVALSGCGLRATTTTSHWAGVKGTMSMSSGKWYYEITASGTDPDRIFFGICGADVNIDPSSYVQDDTTERAKGMLIFCDNGQYQLDGASRTSMTSSMAVNDVLGFAFDLDSGTAQFYKNGTGLGSINISGSPLATNAVVPLLVVYNNSTTHYVNFGQQKYHYAPGESGGPSEDYKSLCAQNLDTPSVAKASTGVDVKLYPGTSSLEVADSAINTSNAYRHHRILFEGDNNGGSVSEIQFFDSNGLINASDYNNQGGSVSSNRNAGLEAWTAFNGTLGGQSHSYGVRKDPSTGFYIAKDWGSGNSKTITGLKIWGVDSYAIAGNTAGKYVKLQGSNDGSSWTDLQTWSDSRTSSWTTNSSVEVAHTSDISTAITGCDFEPSLIWIKSRTNPSSGHFHHLMDTVRGKSGDWYRSIYANAQDAEDTYPASSNGGLNGITSDGFTLKNNGSSHHLNQKGYNYSSWLWRAGAVGNNEVGDYWEPSYLTKYIGFKFPTSSGGRAVFGLISGTGNADIYTSSDNSSWTRVQQNVTLSTTDTTYDSSSQYLIVVNTSDATWGAYHYAMATNGTDAHYSTATYPGSGASFTWSGPAYTDWDFRSSGTVIKPGGLNSSAYDQSRNWTNAWSGTAGYGSFANIHDINTTGNYFQGSGTLTINPSINSNQIRIYGYRHASSGDHYLKINGTNVESQITVGSYNWNTITGITAPITSIEISHGDYSSDLITLKAIEIGGKLLIDQGGSITNVPSIASTTRVDQDFGFSISTWTASSSQPDTIAHNLGGKPSLIIIKDRDASPRDWWTWHIGISETQTLALSQANGQSALTDNGWSVNENTFQVQDVASSNSNHVAYCWKPVEGFSAFGVYEGATNALPYVHCGFKPKLIIIKNADRNGEEWVLYDSERDTFNITAQTAYLNSPAPEFDGNAGQYDRNISIFSNGFRVNIGNPLNQSGTHVWAAWAESPFKSATAH